MLRKQVLLGAHNEAVITDETGEVYRLRVYVNSEGEPELSADGRDWLPLPLAEAICRAGINQAEVEAHVRVHFLIRIEEAGTVE